MFLCLNCTILVVVYECCVVFVRETNNFTANILLNYLFIITINVLTFIFRYVEINVPHSLK